MEKEKEKKKKKKKNNYFQSFTTIDVQTLTRRSLMTLSG